jgi:hypothetical protein
MSLSFPKRGFAGAPVAGTLSTNIALTDTGTTFGSSTPLTGWTDITGSTFSGAYLCVTFGYGTSTEEKILCTYNTSTLTFTISDRGYDGTSAQTWPTGSLFILTWTATEAAELNAATQSLKTILQNTGTVTTPQPILIGSTVASVGSGTKPAAIDHNHKISVSELNSFLGGASANATLGSNLLVPLANLVAGTLPAAIASSYIWSAAGTGASPASITGISGYNNYLIAVAHIWTSGTNAGDNNATVTANSTTTATVYGRSTGTANNHSSAFSFTTGKACGVTTTGSFNASVTTSQVTGTSNTHTLFVIGFN